MLRFITTRLLHTALVVFGVTSLVFFLIHFIPGDPVEVMLGESAQAADRVQLRHALGLDQPLLQQWGHYLTDVVQLDLGQSLHSRRANLDILLQRLPATVELALSALLIAVVIAFPLGMSAAIHKDRLADHSAMAVSLMGIAVPNFLMGPLLIMLFSVKLGWFPVSGREGFASLILPALTLGSALAAVLSRMIRSALLEVLNQDYIRTARAKGLMPLTVIWRHALRNALLPVTTLLGLQFGALLAGAVITEVVFAWPGIGSLTIAAIQQRDYPLVQACVLLISLSYVFVNMLTEIVYGLIDPRIRLATTTA